MTFAEKEELSRKVAAEKQARRDREEAAHQRAVEAENRRLAQREERRKRNTVAETPVGRLVALVACAVFCGNVATLLFVFFIGGSVLGR